MIEKKPEYLDLVLDNAQLILSDMSDWGYWDGYVEDGEEEDDISNIIRLLQEGTIKITVNVEYV
jgi:hypothetical protein